MKRAVISVSNDLVTDQRVQRTISVLREQAYSVNFVGRELAHSAPFLADHPYKRFKLPFNKGFLFYASLNLRLFFYLLFKKPYDLYWSNDLDTLLPNYLIAKLYSKPLVYDSHEYFCGVPEIQDRPLVKGVWKWIESWIFPKLKHIITVNQSIANLYDQDYNKRPLVLRNVGNSYFPKKLRSRSELGLPEEVFLVVNQGAGINIDRGMEEFMEALALAPDHIHLLILGKGDVLPILRQRAAQDDLKFRVHFVDPMPYEDMLQYTAAADLGISLDKDTNLNYRYSLPNKLFDYIKSGIPILCSELIEVRGLVERFNIGIASPVEPEALLKHLMEMERRGKAYFKANLKKAAQANTWAEEKKVLEALILEIEHQEAVQTK